MRVFLSALTKTLAAAAMLILSLQQAQADLPAHAPGSICATSTFWCWATVYGPVGSPCTCPTPGGDVGGFYV